MIIQLHGNIEPAANAHIIRTVNQLGYTTTEVHTQFGRYIIGIGKANFDIRTVGQLPGVMDVHQVSDDYQLVSRKWKVAPTTAVDVAGEMVGNGGLALLAGPCSIESEEQVVSVIEHLRANQIPFMRGGVFKPRSSPYAFRGLGIEGLKMWSFLARQAGIKIVSEVMQVSQIADMHDYVDVFQVGARNTQNFNLLDELGKVDKPVMLKRGISGTIEELLHSAEYVFSAGNERIILCERGIRTYERASRNTLDINAVPILKDKTHLPVVVDPSHGIGLRDYIQPVALAAVMAGADGIMYEAHAQPERAASDAQQTVSFEESARLVTALRKAHRLVVTL